MNETVASRTEELEAIVRRMFEEAVAGAACLPELQRSRALMRLAQALGAHAQMMLDVLGDSPPQTPPQEA